MGGLSALCLSQVGEQRLDQRAVSSGSQAVCSLPTAMPHHAGYQALLQGKQRPRLTQALPISVARGVSVTSVLIQRTVFSSGEDREAFWGSLTLLRKELPLQGVGRDPSLTIPTAPHSSSSPQRGGPPCTSLSIGFSCVFDGHMSGSHVPRSKHLMASGLSPSYT